jgi:hypothetical protein
MTIIKIRGHLPLFAGLIALCALALPSWPHGQRREAQSSPPTTAYELLGKGPVIIPFEIYRGDIRFRCRLNGKDVLMLVDDGFMWDELLLWGPVKDLGLKYTGELPAYGSSSSAGTSTEPPSRIAEGITLELPGIRFTHETAVVSPAGSWYERAFAGSVGQVSGTFLKNFTVRIDFDRMLITLMDPEHFQYGGNGQAVSWEPMGFGPWSIPVTFDTPDGRRIEMPVLMDLGYNDQVQILTGDKHRFTLPDKRLVTKVQRGAGVETFHLGRLPRVTIGAYELRDVLVSFLPEGHNTRVFSEVMLGLNLLSRFNVVYDYSRHRMYLEPNARFNAAFEYNMSGFETRPGQGGALEVREVYPDSPASAIKLAVGDLISHINGRPAGDFHPDELRNLWRQEGATVTLRLVRGDRVREVQIRLKRLI